MSLKKPPLKQEIIQKNGDKFLTSRPWWNWFNALWTRLGTTNRITSADSPYTLTASVRNLMCDTDGGAITVNLEAGTNATEHNIRNTGTSGNRVTLTPYSTQLLFQVNGSETIYDQEQLSIAFQSTEGWG